MAGRPAGPLAGVPVGIKNLVLTSGIGAISGSITRTSFLTSLDRDD
jgi:Asp-tRNA(Asn)/Glu-tRNA(Gln) amidotransferase A subunit family amidase